MKKNLQILEFEGKQTKAGKPYTRFKTNEGWMSCFDGIASEALKKLGEACVEVEETKSADSDRVFYNIKKCYGDVQEIDMSKMPKEVPVEKISRSTNGTGSMYAAYAKDIFCVLMEHYAGKNADSDAIMAESINLVKQAKAAFD